MLKIIIQLLILVFLQALLVAGEIKVIKFSPNHQDPNFEINDVVKIGGYPSANYSLGFSICFRILFNIWKSSCLFQSQNEMVYLVFFQYL